MRFGFEDGGIEGGGLGKRGSGPPRSRAEPGPSSYHRMTPKSPPPSHPLEVIIRPAVPADLPALGRLGALLVGLHHDLDPACFIPAGPDTERGYAAWLGTQLGKPSVVVFVAEQDGEVIGYTYADVEGYDYMALRGPAGELHDIMVDPARRGGGVGRKLLDTTLAALKARGAPRVVLSTAAGNVAAQRLFASVGFRTTMHEMTRELNGEE